MAKTAAERKRDQRDRWLKSGIKDVTVRMHVDDKEAVRKYAKSLLDDRQLKNT